MMEFMLGLNIAVMVFSVVALLKIRKLNKEYKVMMDENEKNWSEYKRAYERLIKAYEDNNKGAE